MAFHDLCVKFYSDKKPAPQRRHLKAEELLQRTEYGALALNYSMYTQEFPLPEDRNAYKRLSVKHSFRGILDNLKELAAFDVVSVSPTNERDFQYCCREGDCDIISLKMYQKLWFSIDKEDVEEALRRGLMFELCYSGSLRELNDRSVFVSNASHLIRCTAGRNLIMSSGCCDYMEQRAPWDVINMACVLGLSFDRANESVTSNPESALKHGRARHTFMEAFNHE